MAKTRVLVVDDEESMRYFLRRSLKRKGYEVRVAESGEEAVEAARADPPDVVLLDLRLPGMDGLAVLERLREEAPDSVVLMMTGYGTVDRALEAMRRGASDFLTKPLQIEQVEDKIADALAKAASGPAEVPLGGPSPLPPGPRPRGTEAVQPLTAYLREAAAARKIPLPETSGGDLPLREASRVFEALYFTELFHRTGGNVSLAARIAGISRPSLHRKISDLGLDVDRYRK
jgi:DNA-binding NtrC family response regulator